MTHGPTGATTRRARTEEPEIGVILALLAALACPAAPLGAQPVTNRTPNIPGPWVPNAWNLHFGFAHRFQVVGGGESNSVADIFDGGKIVNYPTFDLSLGLPGRTMAGVRYSSNSLIVGNVNEWQPFVKYSVLDGTADGKLSLATTLAWNGAAQSADAEVVARTRLDPFFFLVGVRGYSDVFDQPPGRADEAMALTGGLGLRVNRYLSLTGDVGDLVAGPVEAPAGWSAGLQLGIPFTPHTLSIQATNVYSGTLQGTVTGDRDNIFWGFEFTVPFSGFARWSKIFTGDDGDDREPVGPAPPPPAGEGDGPPVRPGGGGERTVEVKISQFAFQKQKLRIRPGTTVRWVNDDPVGHTTTSDARLWDSPLLGPRESYEATFREPGRYPYHCTPHPFMEAVVIVER